MRRLAHVISGSIDSSPPTPRWKNVLVTVAWAVVVLASLFAGVVVGNAVSQ